jgi:hypothetical protein
VTLRDFVEFPTVAEVLDAGEVSGGRISDRCGSFVEGVRGDGRLLQHVTRRPPRRAPCLARHYQVTMRASFNVSAQANLDRNCPSGMGDRRVGT